MLAGAAAVPLEFRMAELLITVRPWGLPTIGITGYCWQPPAPAPRDAVAQTVCGAAGPEPATKAVSAEPGSSMINRASETLLLIKRLVTLVPKLTEILAV